MKTYSWFFTALMVLMVLAGGCGKQGSADPAKVFDGADATLKGYWEKAQVAVKANDYAGAITLLFTLRNQPNLTPKQYEAVQIAFSDMYTKTIQAANGGDANAKKALDMTSQLRGR